MNIRRSIRWKLNAVLTLCALLFVLIAGPVISYISYENYKRDADAQQARLVEAVRTSAAIATFVKNEEIADEVLNGLLQDDEILAAELVGSDGFSIVGKSDSALPKNSESSVYRSYALGSPVDPEQKIGEIRLWANETLIAKRARRLAEREIILLVGMSFLLSLVSMVAANKLVGRPLTRLAQQLLNIKPGSAERIEVNKHHRGDEIGFVSDGINNFLLVTRIALDKERQLREHVEKMNQHFSNIFATSHVAILVLDERGILLHHNPVLFDRFIRLTNTQREKIPESDFFRLAFKSPDAAWDLVEMARAAADTVSADMELHSAWKVPCWVHCLLSVNRDETLNTEDIEVVLYDVTKRVEETEMARQQANTDPLTGLQNRRGCETYLQRKFRSWEEKTNVVAMLLDLDGFKPINDEFGHAVGDKTLQLIADRLLYAVRVSTDLVGRLGGDEFLIVMSLRHGDREHVKEIATKIIEKVSQPIDLESLPPLEIGVSIGIAYAADYGDAEAMLQAADAAMYQVKAKGKNGFSFASR